MRHLIFLSFLVFFTACELKDPYKGKMILVQESEKFSIYQNNDQVLSKFSTLFNQLQKPKSFEKLKDFNGAEASKSNFIKEYLDLDSQKLEKFEQKDEFKIITQEVILNYHIYDKARKDSFDFPKISIVELVGVTRIDTKDLDSEKYKAGFTIDKDEFLGCFVLDSEPLVADEKNIAGGIEKGQLMRNVGVSDGYLKRFIFTQAKANMRLYKLSDQKCEDEINKKILKSKLAIYNLK